MLIEKLLLVEVVTCSLPFQFCGAIIMTVNNLKTEVINYSSYYFVN